MSDDNDAAPAARQPAELIPVTEVTVTPPDLDGSDALDDAALEAVSGGAVFVKIPGEIREPTPEEQKKIDEKWKIAVPRS